MAKRRKVFLSYGRRDAALAARIARELDKLGIEHFDPANDVEIGADWRAAIRRATKSAEALIVIVGSPDGAGSSWVGYEIGMFDALAKPVIVLASDAMSSVQLPSDLQGMLVYNFDPNMPEQTTRRVAADLLKAA